MKYVILPICFLFFILAQAQELKSPSEFLGYELGTEFTRHHQVVEYYKHVAKTSSDRVQLVEYGKTNERRPLVLAYISSPSNMKNLEKIRAEHLKNTKGASTANKAIVWLSYNVHGNESVSTEASMQTIYDLLTSSSSYLENTVVIIDPCINPDGRDRYVNWFNQFKNNPYTIDPNSKEHNEGWLNGRPNHYMFDLNRDWAWLTQVESRQRLKVYNTWLPHIHVDFHEQGIDNPYYFAPAAEPFHEVITDFQRDFQVTLGKNHAKYFDANGWFYFTKEVFDLLYPSYGDTYPTYNGAIGMTYEQGGGGRGGLGVRTGIGDTLSLKDRIAHHYTTGLSTIEVASNNVEKLNTEFRKFYSKKKYKYNSYVMTGTTDKIDALTRLLNAHQITYGKANKGTVKGYDYTSGTIKSLKVDTKNLVVSTDQTKGTLVKVLFEPRAKLSDSLTYDITAWSLPYAYGLDALASESAVGYNPTSKWTTYEPSTITEGAYAYLADWNSMKDARFLANLLKKDIRVRYAQKPFNLEGKNYGRGSLIITKADNKNHKTFLKTLNEIANKHSISLTATRTGFVDDGKDFGSGSVQMVPKIKVGVLSGKPTSTLQFGEIWHFFEQQLEYPVSILDSEYLQGVDLDNYDVLILPNGRSYASFFKENPLKDLKQWVANGGKLIAMGSVLNNLGGEKGFSITPKKTVKDSSAVAPKSYEGTERGWIKDIITGAIFKTKVDTTHPLAYGYKDTYFTLKLGASAYKYLENGTVVYLEDTTVPISGFAGSEAQKKIAKTMVFGVENYGQGEVIYMVDNPLFRGFWENGKLFFANALFMVN